jgi:hypothetical protein
MTARRIHQQIRRAGLSITERKLVRGVATGTVTDLQAGDTGLDVAQGATWGTEQIVRASVLAELLTGRRTEGNDLLRAVKLRGARIVGPLDLEATELACPLLLQDCYLEEPVNLSEASAPAVRLPGCHLPAMNAGQLRTTGSLELNNGATTHGEVSLAGARIGGQIDLSGATLSNPGGRALFAELLTVDHSMLCRHGFTAHGEVSIAGARIGGRLDLREATLSNPGGAALRADGLNAEYGIICQNGFTVLGEVSAVHARIGGRLDLRGANLSNPGHTALDLRAANISALMLLPGKRPDGVVDLTNTRVNAFSDDPASWPESLRLRGFVYDTLENDQVDVRERLRWLTLHDGGYTSQLYDQLAAAYRRTGQEDAVRKVGITKQWRRRTALNPAGKLLNWLLYVTVGYGYGTWLAGAWLVGLIALGTWVFARAYPAQMIPASAHHTAFHPLAYTLDVLLPIVNLGQQNAWQPEGSALYWSWALTGAGWVLTTAVVAGLTGIFNRN